MLHQVGEMFLGAQQQAKTALNEGHWEPAEPDTESGPAAQQP
jgi:hypothetical protein